MGKLAKVRGEGGEGVSQSSASLRLIELRLEAWQQAAILSDTGGNVNDVNDATGARVFQNKLINCLVAPTNFTTHPGPEVRPHLSNFILGNSKLLLEMSQSVKKQREALMNELSCHRAEVSMRARCA